MAKFVNQQKSSKAAVGGGGTSRGGDGVGRGGGGGGGGGGGMGVFRRMVLLLILAGWTFVIASLIGYDPADPPSIVGWPPNEPVANWCGPLGAYLAHYLYYLCGLGIWVLMLFGGIGILSAAAGQPISHWAVRFIGLLMLTAAASGLQRVAMPWSGPLADLPGGTLGVVGTQKLIDSLGPVGSILALVVMASIGAIVAMDEWVTALVSWTWRRGAPAALSAGKTAGVAAGSLAYSAGKTTAKASGGVLGTIWSRLFSKPAPRENDLDDFGSARRVARESARARRGAASPAVGASASRNSDEIEAEAARLGVVDPDDEAAAAVEEAPARGRRRKRRDDAEGASEDLAGGGAVRRGGDAIGVDEDDEDRGAESASKVMSDDDSAEEVAAEGASDARGSRPRRRGKPVESSEPARPEVKIGAKAESPVEASVDAEDDDAPGPAQVYTESELRAKIEKLPVFFNQNSKQVATDADLAGLQGQSSLDDTTYTGGKAYQFPGMDILENPEENFNSRLESYVREQALALESALKQYNIDGGVVGIESGPVITLYDVRLAPGTKVSAVQAVSSDLARALKAVNIRIVPNQVGRDTIGIEVPNTQKEKVRLKELMSKTERFSSMKLPMFLGKDASGDPLIEDLSKMPHMLIAGTTGSGKSVCMNTIIMSFLYTKKPSELKLVLVDPKMVEMSQFKDIPHLMCPVVTEMGKAAAILEWACVKMDERYELLAEAGCRDITAYNDLSWEELKDRLGCKTDEQAARVPRKLPYMVFIIDELADLMMTAKEVESHIIRIAQKARAVGMHLILATQRPQANVVTGLIKSNMPCRVAFRVASGMDSRIVLDQKGGELLLGHGDMLFLNPRTNKLTRAQGTLVDDKEIRNVVRFMREVAAPSFERSLMTLRRADQSDEERAMQSANNSSASLAAAQEDPLFPRAVEIVLETKRGSVSLLQRRLAIGYTRSSRLIDLMGIAGIISDHKGSVARDVLITPGEWEAMKRLAAEQGVDMSGKEPSQGDLFAGAGGASASGAAPALGGSASGAGSVAAASTDDVSDDVGEDGAADGSEESEPEDAPFDATGRR